MKRGIIILLFFVIFFSSFVSASNVGLIESVQWQWNITGPNYHGGIVAGDIDNDGDLDLITIGCDSGSSSSCTVSDKTYVYINNGTSLIKNYAWQQNLSGAGRGSLALGDINNDGKLDLVISGSIAPYTQIYISNGTTFNSNATWQNLVEGGSGAGSKSVALGDIDNDGDLDLLFPDMGLPGEVIWINNGTTFVNGTQWDQEITDPNKASTGLIDIDNDGDLDLNVFGQDNAKSYINNGTSFVYEVDWTISEGDEASIAWGDFDNDGDFDSISSTFSSITFNINNGSTWSDGSEWNFNSDLSSLAWGSMMLGDYDNNGYLDLVNAGSSGGDKIEIGENNGTTFVYDITAIANLTGMRNGPILWVDVDNDMDLDLVDIKSWKVYISNASLTNPNEVPTAPAEFSYLYENREIKLGWINGSDNETISTGLYYNLKLGTSTNNHSIISGVYGGSGDATRGGTAFGYFGNMMQRKNFTLKVDRLESSTTYYWSVQTIDTGLQAGNWSEVQSFTTSADLDKPVITLNSPIENSNESSYIITFNATVYDNMNLTNVSLWGNWTGSLSLNQTNSSGVNNTDYIFSVDLTGYSDGQYTWQIKAEDNASNSQVSSIRTFTLDTTNPEISIITLNNTNSSDTNLDIDYSVSDLALSSCWYANDSMTSNITLSNCGNITSITWSEGNHNVTIWANDSAGNLNSSSITFTIDTIVPGISIVFPTNKTNTTNTNLNINYSVSDSGVGVGSCWYANDSMTSNITLSNCENITSITWSEGNHNVTIWVNDSVNNINSSSVTFTIDTTAPSFDNPNNFTTNVNYSFSQNFIATDGGVGIYKYYLNDTSIFNISQAGLITNITNISTANIHWLNVSVNDTLGNINSAIFFINITYDVEVPIITLISPADSQGYTSNSQAITFSYNVTDASNVINCSLIINDAVSLSNSTINKSATQTFTQTFTPATYNWGVNCTDALLNQDNSSSRTFTVTAPVTPSSGGGGGGGGGSSSTTTTTTNATTEIEEELFDIDFSKEETGSIEIQEGGVKVFSFNNQITHKITVSELTETSIKLIIESEPVIVLLNLYETKQIDMNGDGINDLEIQFLSVTNGKANLYLRKLEGAEILSLEEIEGAIKKEALFDVRISIVNLFDVIKSGREVIAEIEALNVNNIGQVDIFIDYYITSVEDNQTKLSQGSDTLAVEAVTSFVRSLRVPYESKAGKYLFNVEIKYQDKLMASGVAEFRVIRSYEIIIAVSVVILIVLGIFFYLWRIMKKENILEKEVKKLKRKKK